MATIQLLSSLLTILIVIFISPTQGATQQGFTIDLIHRDSPLSPFHNPSLSKWDSVKKSFDHSISRINHLSRLLLVASGDIQAPMSAIPGAYVMELSLGTPPVSQFGIVDTGSDLIWVQCQPCLSCYKQSIPLFNPNKSSSYEEQSCKSNSCQTLSRHQASCTRRGTCQYNYLYGDRSFSTGALSLETLTFKSNNSSEEVSFPKVTFGCGHDDQGTFSGKMSGLIGLGGGPLSLVSQLSSSIKGKFSYCLNSFSDEGRFTSKINFGVKGVISGPGVVSTPLVKGASNTYYFLTLEGITVKKVRVPFTSYKRSNLPGYGSQEGNIVIDSGTTLTFLPVDFYNKLANSLVEVIQGNQVKDPSGLLKLCYEAKEDLNIPNLTVHFTGADIELKPVNTFIKISDDVVCLAILPAKDIALFGNIAQVNFLVGYDIEERKVSFKPVDCTKGQ